LLLDRGVSRVCYNPTMSSFDQSVAPPAEGSRRKAVMRAALFLLGTAALLFVPISNDYRALWFSAFQDACHIPLFAMLTWALIRFCWPRSSLSVIGALAVTALAVELIQPLVGRSASALDLFFGLVGIACAAIWLARSWPLWWRVAWILILVTWPIVHTGPVMVDAAWAWWKFPLLAGDNSPWPARRWYLQGASIPNARPGMQLAFAANEHGSGAILLPIMRDWRGFRTLEVDFEFEGEPLLLLISVRDGKQLPPELPRFDLWRRYPPGQHHVRIDLAELERGGSFPPIDLSRVQSLHLVAYSEHPREILLSRIRLADESPPGRITAAARCGTRCLALGYRGSAH
jgi:hypothetical protein